MLSLALPLTALSSFLSQVTPGDKFDKQYLYAIRHNYGKEGNRKDYTPYSCARIIGTTPGVGQVRACVGSLGWRQTTARATPPTLAHASLPPCRGWDWWARFWEEQGPLPRPPCEACSAADGFWLASPFLASLLAALLLLHQHSGAPAAPTLCTKALCSRVPCDLRPRRHRCTAAPTRPLLPSRCARR